MTAEIIDKVLDGCTLRTFMIPDPVIPSNHPEHLEGLELPHIIISDGLMWAKSDASHLNHSLGSSFGGLHAWCYSSPTDLFASYTPETSKLFLMFKSRYKKHVFIPKNDFTLIWDSQENTSTEAIRANIEAGAKLKIAMLDTEDIWNIHPIGLPFYYPDSRTFQLKTAVDEYPFAFRSRQEPSKLGVVLEEKSGGDVKGAYAVKVPGWFAFYCVKSDGTYYNYYDLPRETNQTYERLKVFASLA